MASVQERLKLKRAPTDIWNIREQLCLASSVLKSGDQNWMSVSRSLKPVADKDSTRPPDWFSQKSCAQQYAYLLEIADIPKRKKRESGETTSESIVRRLTQDRIAEITKTLAIQREEYQQLKNEVSLLRKGTVSDEKLQKMWLAIEQEEKEQEHKNKAQVAWLTKRMQAKESQSQLSNTQIQKKITDISAETQERSENNVEEEDKKNKAGKSSLLTSLLKSPSPTTQMQTPTSTVGSPTIASLLSSSPKVSGPIIMQSVPQLPQLISNTVSNAVQERPSASAPTLSMLLEQPSAGSQRVLQQQLQNATNLINSKNLQNPIQVQNMMQTKSIHLSQGNNTQIEEVQEVISNSDLSNVEIPQILTNLIDEVIPKVPMDKDEINEIIGDIEELIKEEIAGSPQTLDTPPKIIEAIDNINVPAPNATERIEPRNVDESVSLSNSPSSEISIEEIDSSTSNIAEIIGTAIETVESKIDTSHPSKETEKIKELKFPVQDINKEKVESIASEELNHEAEVKQTEDIDLKNKINNKIVETFTSGDEILIEQEKNKQNDKENKSFNDDAINCEKETEQKSTLNENIIENKEDIIESLEISNSENIFPNEANNILKQKEKAEHLQSTDNVISKDDQIFKSFQIEDKVKLEDNASIKNNDESKGITESITESIVNESNNISESIKESELINEYEISDKKPNCMEQENQQETKEIVENLDITYEKENKKDKKIVKKELDIAINYELKNSNKDPKDNNSTDSSGETILKKENFEQSSSEEVRKENENLKSSEVSDIVKNEPKKDDKENNEEECKQEKEEIKKEIDTDTIKKESIESVGSVDELDEEEPTLSKLSGGRAMKTYSKKQNATVDSETETETSGETADYRAWKKSIMLVYNRLATHKYASIFLRPITEDQAPGYHSIIFRPMDLWTIKKNIDNGTIRSTTHFQRDVMLMFQNAIMFNKHNTLVHKMTLEMQEECLQHMQVLVRAAGEASFRRETRTAASISNETADGSLKRKWTHITPNPYETENFRTKKRRKSEND